MHTHTPPTDSARFTAPLLPPESPSHTVTKSALRSNAKQMPSQCPTSSSYRPLESYKEVKRRRTVNGAPPRPSHNHLTRSSPAFFYKTVTRSLPQSFAIPEPCQRTPAAPVIVRFSTLAPSPVLHLSLPITLQNPVQISHSPFRHCPLCWSDFFPPRDYPVLSPHIHCTSLSNPRARPVYVRSAPTVGSTPHQGSLHTDCLPAWLAPLGGASLAPSSSSSTIATTAATRCTPVTPPTPLHNYLFTLSPPAIVPPIVKSTSTFFTTSHI